MTAKRIRCECGRVYEPAKHAVCPACGAAPIVATVEPPKPGATEDKPLVRQDDRESDIYAEDTKPIAISARTLAIIGGVLFALIVFVVILRHGGSGDEKDRKKETVVTPTPTAAPTATPAPTASVTPPPIILPQGFDLAGAIANAAPGATIKVPPGYYPGGLVISRGVKLVATGGQAVIQADGHECLSVRAAGVSVQGIQFFCNGIGELPAISITDAADLELDGCRIQSGTALGVSMTGNAGLKATGTTFTASNGAALRMQQGKATLTQSTFADSRTGVSLTSGATIELQACAFERNGAGAQGSLISASGQGTNVTASDCHFTGNYAGAFLSEGATFSATNTSFNENVATNSNATGLVLVHKGARAVINGSKFESNRQGVTIGQGGALEMDKCEFNNNGVQGSRQMILTTMPIAVIGEGATATVRNTTIANSTQIAVAVLNAGNLTLEDVEIYGAHTAGLQIGDPGSARAHAEIRRAKLHHNQTAVGIFAGSTATMEDSGCSENNDGIVVGDRESQLELRKTGVVANRDHGLAVYGEGAATVVECEFRNNARGAQSGMPRHSAGRGFVSLDNCVFGGNRVFAVGAYAQSQLILARINFDGTDKTNIYKERGAIVQMESVPSPSPSASPSEETSPAPNESPTETATASPSATPPHRSRSTPRPRRHEDDASRILRRIFGPH
ncbi:MAG: right-handed parallel beta-helix repeat-containing protein [Chthoniobacterales bacterium]